MSHPISRVICESLKSIEVVSSADQMSELAGRQKSYLRSQWARNKDMSLSAYAALYFSLEDLYRDRHQQMVQQSDRTYSEEELHLFELQFALRIIWELMARQTEEGQR